MINWDGTGLRELVSGYYSTATWRGNGKDWAIVIRHNGTSLGPVYRINIDNPSERVLLWDKTNVGSATWGTWENLSDDGTRMAGTFPHPDPKLVEVANGNILAANNDRAGGCWPQIHRSDGAYFFHTLWPHKEILFVNTSSVVFRRVNIVALTDATYHQACRWTNDEDVICFHEDSLASGPYVMRLSNSAYVKLDNTASQYNGNPDALILTNGSPETLSPRIVPVDDRTVSLGQNLSVPVRLCGVPAPTLTATGLPACLTVSPQTAGYAFTISGTCNQNAVYQIVLTANNSAGTGRDTFRLTIGTGQANQPPQVSAGSDQTVKFYQTAGLQGIVSDDGLPGGGTTIRWRQLTGPGPVTISDSTIAQPTVVFPQAGVFTLELRASDGALTDRDTVTLTAEYAEPIRVIYPAGGEHLVIGSRVSIRWHMDEPMKLGVYFHGTPRSSGVLLNGEGVVGMDGDSTYQWYIDPALFTASDSCRIRVNIEYSDLSNVIRDYSGYFALTDGQMTAGGDDMDGQEPDGLPTTHAPQIFVGSDAIRIGVRGTGSHAVSVLNACGRTVRAFHGAGSAEYFIDRKEFRAGAYVVSIVRGNMANTRTVVIE